MDAWGIVALTFTAVWMMPLLWRPPTNGDLVLASIRPLFLASRQPITSAISESLAYFVHAHIASTPVGAAPLLVWLLGSAAASVTHYVLILLDFTLLFAISKHILLNSRSAILVVIFALVATEQKIGDGFPLGWGVLGAAVACAILMNVYGWLIAYQGARRGYALAAIGTFFACSFSPAAGAFAILADVAAVAVWGRRHLHFLVFWLAVVAAIYFLLVNSARLTLPAMTIATAQYVSQLLLAALPASYRAAGHLHIGATPALYHWTGQSFRYVDDRFIFVPPAPLYASIFAVVACAVVMFAAYATRFAITLKRIRPAVIIGGTFLIVPPVVSIITQAGFPTFGSGTLILEHFGFAIVAVALFIFAISHYERYAIVLTSVLAVGTLVTLIGNARADQFVYSLDMPNAAARSTIVEASRDGFFDRIPKNATIYFSPNFSFMKGLRESPAAYSAFIRAFGGPVLRAEDLPISSPAPKHAWLLQISPSSAVPIDVIHIASYTDGTVMTDRELAYVTSLPIAHRLQGTHVGVRVEARKFQKGFLVDAHRTCGPVLPAGALLEQRPQVRWGIGFFPAGPIGYGAPPKEPTPHGAFYLPASYPKYYFGQTAYALVIPAPCRPTPILLSGIGMAMGPGTLTIEAHGDKTSIRLATTPVGFTLRLPNRGRAILLRFSSTATAGNYHHLNSRYVFDEPEELHTMVEVNSLEQAVESSRSRTFR